MDADVIVIGAGAAGLAAARSLARQSLRVILLDARDRVGGRVVSRPTTRASVPAELGAEFIHGPAHETMELLREIGGAAIDTGNEGWVFRDGTLTQRDDTFTTAPDIFAQSRSLPADESVDTFLRRFEHDPVQREIARMARAFAEGFDAADPADASVLAIAAEWGSGVDSISARPLGGYPALFAHLHDTCIAAGVQTHFSTAVQRIAWRTRSVSLDVTTEAGEQRSLQARAAIVTLPVGVLRQTGDGAVTFDPPLPEPKAAALRSLAMGQVVKVALTFRTPFWAALEHERYRDAAFFRTDGDFGAYWTQYPIRSELVIAWAGGPRAIELAGASEAELIERALAGFGAIFDAAAAARAAFETGYVHDWAHDPYARGAYSYVTVGGGDARLRLAAPLDGTLFFAGEATSNDGQGGTVNGAFETGERAAREAAAALAPR